MGESQIAKFGQPVERVYLQPEHVPAYPGAVRAILEADLIVLGPGSLYTSLLPNLLVPNICAAVTVSAALKLFICNVATERGETDGYSVEDHLAALQSHCEGMHVDGVLVNNNTRGTLPPQAGIEYVQAHADSGDGASNPGASPPHSAYASADVVDTERPWRHDSEKLARAALHWYTQVTKSAPLQREHTEQLQVAQQKQGSRETNQLHR
jgi:uncharacterized cofD-like protein